MAVEFNKELRAKIEPVLKKAGVTILTEYMIDGTLEEKLNYYEATPEEEALRKEYTDKVNAYFDNFDEDALLVKSIKDTITDILLTKKSHISTILNITKHEPVYLTSHLNERCHEILTKTGLFSLAVSADDRAYLDAFICTIKLRYTEPLKYQDFTSKFDSIIGVLNGIAHHCKDFGAPATFDKLNELVKIPTLVEKFGNILK